MDAFRLCAINGWRRLWHQDRHAVAFVMKDGVVVRRSESTR
jgi:hypothetical protein